MIAYLLSKLVQLNISAGDDVGAIWAVQADLVKVDQVLRVEHLTHDVCLVLGEHDVVEPLHVGS